IPRPVFVQAARCGGLYTKPRMRSPSRVNRATQEEPMAVEVSGKPRTSPVEVLSKARQAGVQVVDVRFVDLIGTWQHFSVPISELEESTFEDGLGFDGSSIRGWQAINESDMLVIPQADTAFLDPFFKEPTLNMICSIKDPLSKEDYSRDPRYVARKAVNYMISSGIA